MTYETEDGVLTPAAIKAEVRIWLWPVSEREMRLFLMVAEAQHDADREVLIRALSILIYKLPPPEGCSRDNPDEVAGFWVAELADKNIEVCWNRKKGCFE